MLTVVTTSRFRKDVRRMSRRGANMDELRAVIEALAQEEVLAKKHRDHALGGQYAGFRECHIAPDWLLIYAKDVDKLVLTASRTGTHSDLFQE